MTTATFRNYSGTEAELYASFFVPTIATPVSHELLRVADLQPGERVVDVACGTGVITRAAAERVGPSGSVRGIDLSPGMIEVARKTPAAGAPIDWHAANAESLPLPDGSCDVALCQMGLMFMTDPAAAMAELHRVVAPGGRVVVSAPGPIQPRFADLERAIVDHLGPDLGAFVSTVFSMHDPTRLGALVRDGGFDHVTSHRYEVRLELPGPVEFLWNYVNLTPMGALIADVPETAKDAMEAQLVEAWTPHVVDGVTAFDQPMAIAAGARP